METDTAIMDRNQPEFVVFCIEKIAAIYNAYAGKITSGNAVKASCQEVPWLWGRIPPVQGEFVFCTAMVLLVRCNISKQKKGL